MKHVFAEYKIIFLGGVLLWKISVGIVASFIDCDGGVCWVWGWIWTTWVEATEMGTKIKNLMRL